MFCQVKFKEWTRDDRLRQAVFLGIREDKNPNKVVREKAKTIGLQSSHSPQHRRSQSAQGQNQKLFGSGQNFEAKREQLGRALASDRISAKNV
jgi:ATP-dependent DNA ligase